MEFIKEHRSIFDNGKQGEPIAEFRIRMIDRKKYKGLEWKDKMKFIEWMQECREKIEQFEKEIIDNNIPY